MKSGVSLVCFLLTAFAAADGLAASLAAGGGAEMTASMILEQQPVGNVKISETLTKLREVIDELEAYTAQDHLEMTVDELDQARICVRSLTSVLRNPEPLNQAIRAAEDDRWEKRMAQPLDSSWTVSQLYMVPEDVTDQLYKAEVRKRDKSEALYRQGESDRVAHAEARLKENPQDTDAIMDTFYVVQAPTEYFMAGARLLKDFMHANIPEMVKANADQELAHFRSHFQRMSLAALQAAELAFVLGTMPGGTAVAVLAYFANVKKLNDLLGELLETTGAVLESPLSDKPLQLAFAEFERTVAQATGL